MRWFQEQYGWGCDACRQMFPAHAPAAAAPAAPVAHATARSRTGLWIALGAVVVVGGIVVAAVAASGGSESGGGGGGSASGSVAGSGSASGAGAVATPPVPSTGIAECDKVAALRPRIEACAAIDASTRETALSMADNNLSGAAGATGEYAEYVRPKCAGTAAFLADTLADAGCAPRERARATGFSVPVPSGWQVVTARGQLPRELILEERLPGLGYATRASIYIELVPYVAKSDATGTADNCRSFAEYVARQQSTMLLEQRLVTTKIGPACLNRHDAGAERQLGMQVNVGGGRYTAGVTCTYDLKATQPPAACLEMVDGLTLD